MPFDPNYSSLKFLLHSNGADGGTSFTDSSPAAGSITAEGNAQVDTGQSKFGGASALFDGTGDWLSIPNDGNRFDFGSGDFTIAYWMRTTSVTSWKPPVTRQDATVVVPWSITNFGSSVYVYLSFDNSTWATGSQVMQYTFSNTTWTHVALTRSGSTFRLFIDGTERDTYSSASSFTNSTKPLRIGGNSTYSFAGNLDEVAIWKGVAKWTANFTPPISEWTNLSPGLIRSRMSGEMQQMGMKL